MNLSVCKFVFKTVVVDNNAITCSRASTVGGAGIERGSGEEKHCGEERKQSENQQRPPLLLNRHPCALLPHLWLWLWFWFRYNIQSRRILEVSVPICYLERVCDGLRRKCRMITGHWAVGSVSSEERKINLILRHLKEEMSDEFLFLGFEISHIYLGPAYLIFSQLVLYKAYWLFGVGVCKKLAKLSLVLARFRFGLNFLKSKYFNFGFGVGFFDSEIDRTNWYIDIYVNLKHDRVNSLVEWRACFGYLFTSLSLHLSLLILGFLGFCVILSPFDKKKNLLSLFFFLFCFVSHIPNTETWLNGTETKCNWSVQHPFLTSWFWCSMC